MQDITREKEVYGTLRDLSQRFWTNRRVQLHLSQKIADGTATDQDIGTLEHLREWAATHQRVARETYAELLQLRGLEEEIDAEQLESEIHWGDRVCHDLNHDEWKARADAILREEHGEDWKSAYDDEEILDDPDSGLAGIG